jgi:hypothetical protein
MIERLVTGCLGGIALFWVGASFQVRGDGVPDLWLPVAMGLALAFAMWPATWAGLGAARPAERPPAPTGRAPLWATGLAWLLIGTACAAVAYGAIATPSRHWDGAASFDAKVYWLTQAPTLQQPFFAAEGVFHHSPDYPLLLPLLVAMLERLLPGCGRLALPALYLLLCGVVAASLRLRAVSPPLRIAIVLAVALTPSLISPGGGAVDSGYSELPMLLATTTIAGGLLADRPRLVALGAALALVSKPEGLPYAMLVPLVAFVHGRRHHLLAATVAIAFACWTWIPVQRALLHQPPRQLLPWLIVGFGAVLALDALARWARLRTRGRAIVALAMPVVGLLSLPWIAPLFRNDQGALAIYVRHGDDLLAGLGNLPAYLRAVLDYGLLGVRLGLALVMPLACALVAWRRRTPLPDREVLTFVALGLAVTALPFVLSPEPDLGHHLRSSATRLLLHWTGPLWLLSAGWLDAILRRRVDCAPAAATTS